jgi:hypothetical protein
MSSRSAERNSQPRKAAMFSKIRKRLTYANVAMTLALVFAMSGGAYAASKYLITSTKQIKPSVLKSLKGKAGAAGAAGAQGAQGLKGETGAAGASVTGKEGPEGKAGKDGKEGLEGKEGSPWTVNGTLPSEKSEYGVWSDIGNNVNGAKVDLSIPFTLPLESEPVGAEFVALGGTGTHCTGSATAPTAPAGYLCVYNTYATNEELLHVKFLNFVKPTESTTAGVSTVGTLLELETVDIGKGLPSTVAAGTWAVTAK